MSTAQDDRFRPWESGRPGVMDRDATRTPVALIAHLAYGLGTAIERRIRETPGTGKMHFFLVAEHLPDEAVYWSFLFLSATSQEGGRIEEGVRLPQGDSHTLPRFIHPGMIEIQEIFRSALAHVGLALLPRGVLSFEAPRVLKRGHLCPQQFEIAMTFHVA